MLNNKLISIQIGYKMLESLSTAIVLPYWRKVTKKKKNVKKIKKVWSKDSRRFHCEKKNEIPKEWQKSCLHPNLNHGEGGIKRRRNGITIVCTGRATMHGQFVVAATLCTPLS